MISTYRTMEEVRKTHLPPRMKKVVRNCMRSLVDAYGEDYDPDDCGYVVLYTRETTDQDALDLFGTTWVDARLEGVSIDKEAKCALTCVLCNNYL